MLNQWHAEEREVVLHRLGADAERGLAPAESTRRLREHGPNSLSADRAASGGGRRARKILDPFMLAPLLAAGLCAWTGQWTAAAVAGAVAVANALLGLRRERPDRDGDIALARLSAPAARVVRGGRSFLIPSAELVPGDLAEVAAGDRVPADLRLFRARRLIVDESSLTGASLPVGKDAAAVHHERTAVADRSNMLFAGTLVSGGDGAGVVIATGTRTELGRIARLLADATAPAPPLRRRLGDLGQAATLALLGCIAAAAAALRLGGGAPAELLSVAACLALSTVPAGLPAAIAAALAAGTRRLQGTGARAGAPATAEALGGVDAVVTEKTGTLTRNELTVRELVVEDEVLEVTGSGYSPEGRILRGGDPVVPAAWESLEIALRIAACCTTATLSQEGEGTWRVHGDPVDGALLSLAAKGGVWRDDLLRLHPLLAVFPSTVERGRMTVVAAGRAGRPTALTKGTPGAVLAHCLHQRTAAGVRPLSPAGRERILRRAEEMGERALQVVALAYREDAAGDDPRAVERSLVWVGLAGMLDPPREGIAEAVAACAAAGIVPVIATGDRREAALALAREIGALRPGDEAISGEELELLTPEALNACIERYRICARANAEHKLRIVRAWKGRGRRVAMIGEGVIDAPALREADVGIVLGAGGSEVARAEAAVVVAEGGLATVAAAVVVARACRGNLERVAAFLLAPAAAATLVLLASVAARLPLPLTPLRALWIALVAGLLPAYALSRDASAADPPGEQPGGPGERSPGRAWRLLALAGGAVIALTTGEAFLALRPGGGWDAARAGTHAFAALSLAPPLLVFAFRRRPQGPFAGFAGGGRGLLAAVAISWLLVVAVVQVPLLGGILGAVPLGRAEWARIAALALLPLAAVEIGKARLRARREE